MIAERKWHDLALLSLAVDSMLRASDLLSLKVDQVQYPSKAIKGEVRQRQRKTKRNVYPALTDITREYMALWLRQGDKEPRHFVFTRGKEPDASPITRGTYADLIKGWAQWLGLDPAEYSTHSLRRTKPVIMFNAGEPIEVISLLLGHQTVAATINYLGINQKKASEAARRYSLFAGPEK